jgi:hypothetical protein
MKMGSIKRTKIELDILSDLKSGIKKSADGRGLNIDDEAVDALANQILDDNIEKVKKIKKYKRGEAMRRHWIIK